MVTRELNKSFQKTKGKRKKGEIKIGDNKNYNF
jgi:hypothetical protein